jgi:hypothetical protein
MTVRSVAGPGLALLLAAVKLAVGTLLVIDAIEGLVS